MVDVRYFDGDRFEAAGGRWDKSKRAAQEHAKMLREKGYRARVTHSQRDGYEVWRCP